MRPACDKCGGVVIPEYDFNNRVSSVKCTLCGKRHWREFRLRRPSSGERAPDTAGAAHHKKARR